jgi:succinate dehydrogenase / fumarate reductase, iron-sulfur subunit
MKLTFRILRFNPEKDPSPHFEDYLLDLEPGDSVLKGLLQIKGRIDGSLAFRRSCGHGICGSDAMIINAIERLACKTLIKDLDIRTNPVVTIEPLTSMPHQKDLLVDQTIFFAAYKKVKPFFIGKDRAVEKEALQSPSEREAMDDPSKCILCASCYSSCPVVRKENPAYIGPAAIVNGARFVYDSRDKGLADEERLAALNDPDGVWPCKNYFSCTRVCPRGIKVTKHINAMKTRITKMMQGGTSG